MLIPSRSYSSCTVTLRRSPLPHVYSWLRLRGLGVRTFRCTLVLAIPAVCVVLAVLAVLAALAGVVHSPYCLFCSAVSCFRQSRVSLARLLYHPEPTGGTGPPRVWDTARLVRDTTTIQTLHRTAPHLIAPHRTAQLSALLSQAAHLRQPFSPPSSGVRFFFPRLCRPGYSADDGVCLHFSVLHCTPEPPLFLHTPIRILAAPDSIA